MRREQQVIKRLFAKLLRAKRTKFPSNRGRPVAPDKQGVYLIFSPRGRVLHVGRTVRGRGGLRQRLNDHLQGQSSFTLAVFKRQGWRLRGAHGYACVVVRSARRRALLESYAVGMLCPKHLGVGEKAASRRTRRTRKS